MSPGMGHLFCLLGEGEGRAPGVRREVTDVVEDSYSPTHSPHLCSFRNTDAIKH